MAILKRSKARKTKALAPENEEVLSDEKKRKRRRASAPQEEEEVVQSPSPPKDRAKATPDVLADPRNAARNMLAPRSAQKRKQAEGEECWAGPSSKQKKDKSGGSRTPSRPAREHARSEAAQPWVYLGCTIPEAVLNRQGGPGAGYMKTPDGRYYPTQAVFSANDKLLDAYKDLPTTDEEYVIEAILDERRRGVETAFRVKWRGYELNSEEWIPYELLADTVALEAWEARQRGIVEAWELEGTVNKHPCAGG